MNTNQQPSSVDPAEVADYTRHTYSGCGLGGTAFSPLSRETCTDQKLVAL